MGFWLSKLAYTSIPAMAPDFRMPEFRLAEILPGLAITLGFEVSPKFDDSVFWFIGYPAYLGDSPTPPKRRECADFFGDGLYPDCIPGASLLNPAARFEPTLLI